MDAQFTYLSLLHSLSSVMLSFLRNPLKTQGRGVWLPIDWFLNVSLTDDAFSDRRFQAVYYQRRLRYPCATLTVGVSFLIRVYLIIDWKYYMILRN